MKILSWNIWQGKYLDKVMTQIAQENPDVICLQEVIEKEVDGQRLNAAHLIASKLGYEFVFCKSFTTDWKPPADLGNAILSRMPILSSACHMLSTLDAYQGSSITEPRTVVLTDIKIASGKLTLATCHLGYGLKFQETEMQNAQLDQLLKILPNTSLILSGDFNSLPESRIVRILNNVLSNADLELSEYSYTDMRDPDHPEYRIDYIFTTPDIVSKDFEILSTDASDHSPLILSVTI